MTASQSVKRYQLFQRLTSSDAEAQAFVQEVEAVVDNQFEQKKEVLATKDDLRQLEVKIAEGKAELIKWMFIFWAGCTASCGLFPFRVKSGYQTVIDKVPRLRIFPSGLLAMI